MKLSSPLQKAKDITLLVLDVDGVLTDASRDELTSLEAQYR
jgi:hypothetical protein